MDTKSKHHFSTHYRIRVKGHLEEKWSEWFKPMTISAENNVTTLDGQVPDQAALHGLLIRIRDLNLTLLEVRRLKREKADRK